MESWQQIIWAAPMVVLSAIIIGWAAETSQLYISQGLALAILAWLQTAPEFAVEAVIAWHQKQNLMIANLTGSLRLLVGFGWPLVYFTHALLGKKRKRGVWPVITLEWFNGLEVLILLLATIYFSVVWIKGSLTVGDSVFLFAIYILYLIDLARLPKGFREGEEDLPWIGHKISKMKSITKRNLSLLFLFAVGGVILKFSAEPFLHGLEAVAAMAGLSTFYFVQWVAPFVSEFPEKVTAFQWARKDKKAPMAVINMVSSNVVQWTVMAGMIPIIFSISRGEATPIFFDDMQLHEIKITILQSFLSILFIMDLELSVWNAIGLVGLWGYQFFLPEQRDTVMMFYEAWIAFELVSLAKRGKLFFALTEYRRKKSEY